MTDDSSLQVGCSAEVIDDFSGDHVLHQGIYGKVPPLRRFLRTEEGICKDFKIPVSPSGGFFPSGHCNIKVVSLQAVYAEAGTDFRRLSETAEISFNCCGVTPWISISTSLFSHPRILSRTKPPTK